MKPYLTSLALAIWFMDDGYKCKQGVCFATHCYSLESLEILQQILKENFDLSKHHVISLTGESSWRLYISKSKMPRFASLVKPYMLDCMMYKLGE